MTVRATKRVVALGLVFGGWVVGTVVAPPSTRVAGATTPTATVTTTTAPVPTVQQPNTSYAPKLASLTLAQNTAKGGSFGGSFTLQQAPPWQGSSVVLSSSSPQITFSVLIPKRTATPSGTIITTFVPSTPTQPMTVALTPGTATYSFLVNVASVAAPTTVTITAAGSTSMSAVLSLQPPAPKSIALTPTDVAESHAITGTVTLDAPAPAGGMVVPLSSNNEQVSFIDDFNAPTTAPGLFPAITSVTVPQGALSASFSTNVTPVNYSGDQDWCAWVAANSAMKSCAHGHYRAFGSPSYTYQFATSHHHAHKGETVGLTVSIQTPAPSGGWYVALPLSTSPTDPTSQWYWQTCGGAPSITGPSGVTIPVGATQATVTYTVSATSNCGEDTVSMMSGGTGPGSRQNLPLLVIDPARIQDNG